MKRAPTPPVLDDDYDDNDEAAAAPQQSWFELVFPKPVWLAVEVYLPGPPADPYAPLPADPAAYTPLVLNLLEVATATPHWGPEPDARKAPPATVVHLNTGQVHCLRMPFRLFVAHLMKV